MRKLIVFNSLTVDGYYTGGNGDMSWAHAGEEAEWNAFVAGNANGELLFVRLTYELMASYWPTPMAIKNNPIGAEGMNRMPTVVFSRTLDKVSRNNLNLKLIKRRTFANGKVFLC